MVSLKHASAMATFVGYGKIGLGTCGTDAGLSSSWCVTEKVHGANFSIHFDGGKLRCAKRKGFLDENEDFFGHFGILTRLRSSLVSMARDIMELKVEKVIIYGELCGGKYPHPDVKEVAYTRPVQVGVWHLAKGIR